MTIASAIGPLSNKLTVLQELGTGHFSSLEFGVVLAGIILPLLSRICTSVPHPQMGLCCRRCIDVNVPSEECQRPFSPSTEPQALHIAAEQWAPKFSKETVKIQMIGIVDHLKIAYEILELH
jgi:hypothetical protein